MAAGLDALIGDAGANGNDQFFKLILCFNVENVALKSKVLQLCASGTDTPLVP